jgi:hypothetical protein
VLKLDNETAWQLFCGDSTDEYTVVDNGEWVSHCKFDIKSVVFEDNLTGKYYMIDGDRSGSYYTDYEFSVKNDKETECYEVKKIMRTIEDWQPI